MWRLRIGEMRREGSGSKGAGVCGDAGRLAGPSAALRSAQDDRFVVVV